MDLATTALTVYNLIKPIITSKPAKELAQAAKGSADELWQKVKPWFIIEEKETEELKDLKENPEDKDFEDAFLAKLKTKLKKDETLRKELEAIINDAEKNGDEQTQIIIKNSKNVVTGNISNVTGNIHIGDSK